MIGSRQSLLQAHRDYENGFVALEVTKKGFFSICSGVKMKAGITTSEDFNAKIRPVLSSSRKSRLNKKRDL
jgi:hypothetical protein